MLWMIFVAFSVQAIVPTVLPLINTHTHTIIIAIPSRFQSTRALDENITDSECLFISPLKLVSQFKAIGPFSVRDPDAVEHTPPDFCQEMPPV